MSWKVWLVVMAGAVFVAVYGLAIGSYQTAFVALRSAFSAEVAKALQWTFVIVPIMLLIGLYLQWKYPYSDGRRGYGRAMWIGYSLVWAVAVLGCVTYFNCRVSAESRHWVLAVRATGSERPNAADVLRRHSIACWETSSRRRGVQELLVVPDADERVERSRRILEEAGFQCVN